MEIEDPEVFNNWILPIIKPICLADPDSLARYVVVLLKKSNPKPDLRSYCIQNLSIFIDVAKIKVEEFVDMILDAVENKKYFPSKESKPSDKRLSRIDQSKHRLGSKHGRESPVSSRHGHSSRRSSNRDDRSGNGNRKRTSRSRHSRSRSRSERSRSRSPHSRKTENEVEKFDSSKSQICPTFESQGYCLEGESCKFEHPGFLQVEDKDIQAIAATYQQAAQPSHDASGSSTPKTVESMKNAHISPVMAQYLQFGFQQLAAVAAVNPMQQQQPQQMMPGGQQDPVAMFAAAQNQFQQALNPTEEQQQQIASVPVVVGSRNQSGGYHHHHHHNFKSRRNDYNSYGGRKFNFNNNNNNGSQISASQLDNEMEEIAQANAAARLEGATGENNASQDFKMNESGPQRGVFQRGGYGNRRGRGGFYRGGRGGRGGGGNRHPVDTSNNVLEIRKIPRDQNTIGPLHEHFASFGPVVNIQIGFEGDPEAALVTFANHTDALSAYRSAQPLFNNRFIRVFWHHKTENAESTNAENKGDRPQAAAETPSEPAATSEKPTPKPVPPPRAKMRIDHVGEEKAKVTEARNDLAKRRRLLLANYLEMRTNLLEKLKADSSEKVKTEVNTTLQTVEQKIQSLKSELGLIREQKQRRSEGKADEAEGSADVPAEEGQQTGKPKRVFVVDRRPKQLLVTMIPGLDSQSLRQHFGLFCSVESVELHSAGFLITFSSRRDAEVAKARGLVLRGEEVEIRWHQPHFIHLQQKKEKDDNDGDHAANGEERQSRDVTAAAVQDQSAVGPTEQPSNSESKTLFDDGESEDEQDSSAVAAS